MEPKKPAAGLLIMSSRTGRILLNKRADYMRSGGLWSTPGGISDAEDEGNLTITALREFTEEMGITLNDTDLQFVTSYSRMTSSDRLYVTFVVLIDFEFDCFVDHTETTDFGWFDVDTAFGMNIHPKLRSVLADFR